MDRRQFTQVLAAAALAAAAPTPRAFADDGKQAAGADTPFPLSVMLWTVFNDLPFEERLGKVADAGYTNVELVGEYAKWAPVDFAKANAARTQTFRNPVRCHRRVEAWRRRSGQPRCSPR